MFRLAAFGVSTSFAVLAFASAASAQSTAQLDEIVVTAQRRAENIQRSSLAISAVTGGDLVNSGATQATDLTKLVAGVQIGSLGPVTQTFVRGVGEVATNALSQTAVPFNIDGVTIGRASAVSGNFFDISRLEVLKGPQGTLYGRNASGGTINIITNAPSLEGRNGYVVGEVGSYELYRAAGAFNTPLTDTLAVRVAGQVTRRDGYLSDGANDEESEGVRVRLLWEPSDALSIISSADYYHLGGKNTVRVLVPSVSGDPWQAPTDPRVNALLNPLTARPNLPSSLDSTFWNLSSELNWDFGPAELTVIGGYRNTDTWSVTTGHQLTVQGDDAEQTTLEARIGDAGERLKWVAGLYYFNEDMKTRLDTTGGSAQRGMFDINLDTTSYAAFGEATLSVTDRLRLIGGLRYSSEERHFSGVFVNSGTRSRGVRGLTPYPCLDTYYGQTFCYLFTTDQTTDTDATTWRAGAEFDLAETSMLFFTVSKGFTGGGFFTAPTNNFYGPEEVVAYELGWKNTLLDGRLRLNAEAFYWDYANKHESFIGFDTLGNPNFVTANAGSVVIQGVNLEADWRAMENTRLSFSVEYLDATYEEFRYTQPVLGGSTPGGCRNLGVVAGSSPAVFGIDCSGRTVQRAPEWNGRASVTQTFPLSGGSSIEANLSSEFSSSYVNQIEYVNPNARQDAFALFDASLTYNNEAGRYAVTAWVRNIGDEAIYVYSSNATGFPAGYVSAGIRPPRTYGVRVRKEF